jgi:hypothetical protein
MIKYIISIGAKQIFETMRKRPHNLYPLSSLLIGLVLAQILATLQVYLSNAHLYDSLVAIRDAGFLPVPNHYIMDQLHNFRPAFYAGLFFTFSIGTGISFLSLASAWIWDRLLLRRRYFLYLLLMVWLAGLILLNFNGFNFLVTLYFLMIPPAVFTTALRGLNRLEAPDRRYNEIIHILPVVVLALLLSWQLDNRMFTDFRDIFLLSNPIGSAINRFYYKYTLYAAEAFKSLDQKMLKTCAIDSAENNTAAPLLEKLLADYDYIPIGSRHAVDLTIAFAGDDFIFENHGKNVLRISSNAFFADPGKALKEFSQKNDAFVLFRRIAFWSLLTGFPLAIYVLMQGLITIVLGFYFDPRKSSVIASALCFLLCAILFFAFHLNRSREVPLSDLAEALNSSRWRTRVAALKTIEEQGLEIKRFQAYPRLLASANVAERYWFARTLANSRSPSTYRDLLTLLDDQQPNVLTMACYALGKRGNRQAVGSIINLIERTPDWYSQWYAYNALKALGWRQKKSN